MNARASENYLAISSKSVEIFWAEIYWGQLFLRAESSLIQSSCRSFIRVIVPYEISKGNFRVETKILVSTVIGHKWVPKMADVICENLFPICYSLLNQCYLPLISNVHILHNAKIRPVTSFKEIPCNSVKKWHRTVNKWHQKRNKSL